MKVEKRDGDVERRILIGLIVSKTLLARVATHWNRREGGFFASPWSNLVAGWCLDHFRKYKEAPREAIGSLFETWVQEQSDRDEEVVRTISSFLGNLSRQYERDQEELNPDYLTDLAARHFNRIRLLRLADAIHADLEAGLIEQAQERQDSFKRVQMGTGSTQDLLASLCEAFEDLQADSLFHYPQGPLGDFFGDVFERSGFVSFFAPTGRGKTYWLMDVAWRAMLKRRRVLFFEVGDMTRRQLKRRFVSRILGHPFRSTNKDGSWPCRVKVPIRITPGKWSEGVPPEVACETREFSAPPEQAVAVEAAKALRRDRLRSEDSFFELFTCSAHTLNVFGIDSEIQKLQDEDWPPDVVLIDYADLLAPVPGIHEPREKIAETWIHLRRLSCQHHCLVVTATQSDAASYTKRLLNLDNFSDDRRKNDHVTAMIGLNQTEEEKHLGVMRLNYVKLRDGESSVSRVVHVAGSLAIASPALCSAF